MSKRNTRRVLAATCIGNFGEIYDFAVVGFSIPVLAGHFFPANDPTAALLSTFAAYAVAFFARPLGGLLFGVLADKIGRIKILSTTVILMSAGTAMVGLLPTYATIGIAAPIAFVLCRIIQGLAMGGETTSATSFILEWSPDDRRGWYQGVNWFFSFCPNAFTALFVLAIQYGMGHSRYVDWGWRIPFLMGGLVGVVGFWLRRRLDDPEEFKQAVRESAEAPLRAAARAGLRSMLHVIFIEVVLSVGAYMLLGFMYTFLVREAKLDTMLALVTNAIAVMVLSVCLALAGRVSDRYGRKPVMSAGAAWVALAAYPALHLAASGTFAGALAGQTLLAIGVGIYSGGAFITMPELFPTSFRATGLSISYQLAVAVFGGTTPLIATWLIGASGSPLAPGVYAAAAGLIGLVLIQWVPETRWTRLRTSVDEHVDSASTPSKASRLPLH
ncbi:MFS transporter [Burkholderia sp. Bp9143]|uniref:MFS transporter n=1 Tax=Burkholderia TaxID=32008 RepID=UPI000F59B1DF|nr:MULTISPECIES: MFS transporter [Burkholderia]RQR22838.1 MFS transporter [Burkholderia sp. Bp9143]